MEHSLILCENAHFQYNFPQRIPRVYNFRKQKKSNYKEQKFHIFTKSIQDLVQKTREIERLQIDIVVLTETNKKVQEQEGLDNYIWNGVKTSSRTRAQVSVILTSK